VTATTKKSKTEKAEHKITVAPMAASVNPKKVLPTAAKYFTTVTPVSKQQSTTPPLEVTFDLVDNLKLEACMELTRWLLTSVPSLLPRMKKPLLTAGSQVFRWRCGIGSFSGIVSLLTQYRWARKPTANGFDTSKLVASSNAAAARAPNDLFGPLSGKPVGQPLLTGGGGSYKEAHFTFRIQGHQSIHADSAVLLPHPTVVSAEGHIYNGYPINSQSVHGNGIVL
jgi:hypothetical protein